MQTYSTESDHEFKSKCIKILEIEWNNYIYCKYKLFGIPNI